MVKKAIDAAIEFVGPFLERTSSENLDSPQHVAEPDTSNPEQLVEEALFHLKAINKADQEKDPDAPYDASLVGVVYGLLDFVTSLGILPHLSPGVAFGQRPRSVLRATLILPFHQDDKFLSKVVLALMPIFEQNGTGVQPLLTQRILADVFCAVAELAFSPRTTQQLHTLHETHYQVILRLTSTSRLLPILTSLRQQNVPIWLQQRLSTDLSLVPLRPHGVRHTVEFLSLSYLSKNSRMPQEASDSLSQVPIPLEAITQASRLLTSVPSGMEPNEWFSKLSPQLFDLLDGKDGVELSRAAGHIIAGGLLNRKTTGAPGTTGWELFARPLLQTINPDGSPRPTPRQSTSDQVLVDEDALKLALKRLYVLSSSYSHAGLLKRLVHPVILSLWGMILYGKSRPSLSGEWVELPKKILVRYITIACDPRQIDLISRNLFWDGAPSWSFGPGSQGGVEIRQRRKSRDDMQTLISRIEMLDRHVDFLIRLLVDSKIEDEVVGAIFLLISKRWLHVGQVGNGSNFLVNDDTDPLETLSNAKLSEAMANRFKDQFARSPRHIIELMGQLLQNFVDEHTSKINQTASANKPSRANLRKLAGTSRQKSIKPDLESEELVSFALSILKTLVTSKEFDLESSSRLLPPILLNLQYLVQPHDLIPLPPILVNAATNLLQVVQPTTGTQQDQEDPLSKHRETLKTALEDLTSPEPPNRTWALSAIRKLISDSFTFPLIDVPSTTHMLLNASIADPESYVHTAAVPVLVDLATLAPKPTLRILTDTFVDVDERSLRLKKEKEIEQALDFRLRVGEVLSNFVMEDSYWQSTTNISTRHSSIKLLVESMLSLASRRGQRKKTLQTRLHIAELERIEQEEGEAAWEGPIPNLLDPDGEAAEQPDRDTLVKIVQGWADTGIEEDVRVRSSALSILSVIMEKRLEFLSQVTVDAGLQMVLQILLVETGDVKGILRRAAVLVVMGLLRAMDALLEAGTDNPIGLGLRQASEVERVVKWVRDEDMDGLVRSHAESVIEGLETWRMKTLYKIGNAGISLDANLGLEGTLRGLNVNPLAHKDGRGKRGPIVEEIE
ncbi:hypothetical protein B0J11DRAFT_561916 [Dendryphion nanum]|uniref:RNA polymerase II assembly factor Rtp1 C-terminal domain-containing protein n=1 Tax=Dendryphion nanum TaxID=256645 RepID=A0A9P9D7M7_9PLEO|nr:hypothetical protein B0J11DRAFT_561916 [Dendryphion nanum]